jgi:hypothetical protein
MSLPSTRYWRPWNERAVMFFPWGLFAFGSNRSTNSVVGSGHLITNA